MPNQPHREQSGKVSSKFWDCSQIGNEEEEEEEDWQKEDQMEVQWVEDERSWRRFGGEEGEKERRKVLECGRHAKST